MVETKEIGVSKSTYVIARKTISQTRKRFQSRGG
jgi:hypothetical protein